MQSLWNDVTAALQDIVKIVFDNNEAGIDLGFVNSSRGTKGLGRGQSGTGGIKVRVLSFPQLCTDAFFSLLCVRLAHRAATT